MPCIYKEEVGSDFPKHRRGCSGLCKLHVLPKECATQVFQGEAPCQEVEHFYCLHSLLAIASGIFPTCLIFVICFLIFIYSLKKIGCICVGVCACENGCLQRPDASDPLHLKFQVTVIWIWVLCKSSSCSYPPSYVSNPMASTFSF